MWQSNHQQWPTMPPGNTNTSGPNPNAQQQGMGGEQQGMVYGHASQQNIHPYQQQPQLMQDQIMMQQYQQNQLQANQYYVNGGMMNQSSNQVPMMHGYAPLPPPPPPPPPPLGVPPPPPPPKQQYRCELCQVACPNEFSLQQHFNGEKHRKQEAMVKGNNGNREGNGQQQQQQQQQQHSSPFNCNICNVQCRNAHSYQQHVNGEKHRKKASIVAAGGLQTYFCQICNVSCPNQLSYDQHMNGEKHRRQVAGASNRNDNDVQVFHCQVCNVSCPNDSSFAQHMNGEQHKRQVAMVKSMNASKVAGMQQEVGPPTFHCDPCKLSCPNEFSYQQHINGERHRRQVAIRSVKRVAALGLAGGQAGGSSIPPEQLGINNQGQRVAAEPSPSSLDPDAEPGGTEEVEPRKEIRPILSSKASVDKDDSSEEGEIDEETEDIDQLYDEFEGAKEKEASKEQGTPLQNNDDNDPKQDSDSDLDDMFGGGDEAENEVAEEEPSSTEEAQQSQEVANDESSNRPRSNSQGEDETDMFGEDGEGDDKDQESSGNGAVLSSDVRQDPDMDEDESSSQGHGFDVDEYDAMGMFGESSVDEHDIDENEGVNKWQHIKIDSGTRAVASSTRVPEVNEDEDVEDMFGGSSEGPKGQSSESIHYGTQHDEGSSQIIDDDEDDADMFGDTSCEVNDNSHLTKPIASYEHDTAKKDDPTMLDSGLGFVLDYSPDTAAHDTSDDREKPEPGGFVLDYSPGMQLGDSGDQESKLQTPIDDIDLDSKLCTQTPQHGTEEEDNDEADMFGEPPDDGSKGLEPGGVVLDYSPDTLLNETEDSGNRPTPDTSGQSAQALEQEDNAEDEADMFGDSSDEESETAQPAASQIEPPTAPKTQSNTTTTHNGRHSPPPPSGGAMTAAEALAAARNRAKMPAKQISLKRVKVSAQQHKTVKIPESIPQYEQSKRSHYLPVSPDKYWSDMRDWDFVRALNDAMNDKAASKRKTSGTKRSLGSDKSNGKDESLPDAFESAVQYKALWAPLLINEAKAQILSEVSAAQSSMSTTWLNKNGLTMGVVAKVEPFRHARDLINKNTAASLEPTVVVCIRVKGAGMGCPVFANDLLLFVHQSSDIERALRGEAFNSEVTNGPIHNLSQGRLGIVGHALNSRNRSVDGLLARVSQKYWSQYSSLGEIFVIKIGSNVTAVREFSALAKTDNIPLTRYLLNGKTTSSKQEKDMPEQANGTPNGGSITKFDPLASGGNALPVGFRIFAKSKMNPSQLQAITASATEYGDGGFTLIKGPPGTGKSTTLVSILNALHLRQYQEYYNAIEKIVTESSASTYYEELAALNQAAEVKPRILVCAPSNAGIDNVIMKIMGDKFVDGQGTKYSPGIVRVGAGITNSKVKSIGVTQQVDTIISQGSDGANLETIVQQGRQNLKRMQKEIHKLRTRIQAMVECCPYPISDSWEIRIDESNFESSGRVLFVNHSRKTTTFDIPAPLRPNEGEKPCTIQTMPHYVSLLKSLTKYVERHNNETSNLEKYIILQNDANARIEGGGGAPNESVAALLETHVLNSTHIVLTTLGSAGGRAVESANKFKVVVVDEAAQSSEPSTLVALQLGSSHAILVGDPQQLPATIFSVSGRVTKYDRSLFQRLEESGHGVHLLDTQYRMNPVISEFPRHIFYKGMLVDGPNVQQPDFGGSLKTMIRAKFPYLQPFNIFDLDSKEERDGTSLSNKHEALLVLQLYRTLDRETDGMVAKTRVAVITPYSQQSALLKRMFEGKYGPSYSARVEISTVDAFQGREAGIVIYSCVRAGGRGSGIGFLSDVQRMNVALTRAKHFLFVIARRRSIMVNHYWRQLVAYARQKQAIIQVPMGGKQQQQPRKLRSSLIKSPSAKGVSFGAVSQRIYEVNSKARSNKEEIDIYPDLTQLAPMHGNMSDRADAMSDSACSA